MMPTYDVNNELALNMASKSGVYYIFDSNKKCIYVGRTHLKIGERIKQHQDDLWFSTYAASFGYIELNNITEIDQFEKQEIQRLQPRFNDLLK